MWMTAMGPTSSPLAKREVFSSVSIAVPQMVMPLSRIFL